MPRRHRHRRHRGRTNVRLYALVTLACGVLAVLAHFMFEAPSAIRGYAEDQMKAAVETAVSKEKKAVVNEQKLKLPTR